MTNEELNEYYGFKAQKFGFFSEWQNLISERVSLDPKVDRSIVSQDVFLELYKNTTINKLVETSPKVSVD